MLQSAVIIWLAGSFVCIAARDGGEERADVAGIVEQLKAARHIGNGEMSTTQRVVRPVPAYSGHFTRFERFDRSDYAHWSVTGHAFGAGPTAEGEWDSLRRGPRTVAPGVAHSGLLAVKLRGTLRSGPFVISKPFVDFLVAGRKGRVRLVVIDGDAGASVEERVDTPGGAFQWRRQDVSRYRGRRACVEIVDDAPDGWLAVDEIVFADGSCPPPAAPPEMAPVPALATSPALEVASARLDELAAKLPTAARRRRGKGGA